MKKIFLITLIVFSLLSLVSCKGSENMDSKLLTAEQLEQYCLDNSIDCSNVNLDKFISDYELSSDNIEDLNINLLMAEYRDVESFAFIFEDDYGTRDTNFDKNIRYIAFYENKNTSVKSYFVNVESKYLVASADKYVFENVLDFPKQELSEKSIKEIVDKLNVLSVFDWKSYESQDVVDDGCSIKFIVIYDDNTSFEVNCTGIFNEFEFKNYNELIEFMF